MLTNDPSRSSEKMRLAFKTLLFYFGAIAGLFYALFFSLRTFFFRNITAVYRQSTCKSTLNEWLIFNIYTQINFILNQIGFKKINELENGQGGVSFCDFLERGAPKISHAISIRKDTIGVCFIQQNVDEKQLKINIAFFRRFCVKIIIIKNGKTKFEFFQDNKTGFRDVVVAEDYNCPFQDCFVDVVNQNRHFNIIKFDDDDIYLRGSVELLIAMHNSTKASCVSLKPLIYRFEHWGEENTLFLSRRFLLPIMLSCRFYNLSGTLMFFSKDRALLVNDFKSKYLDRSLSYQLRDKYVVCTSFSIIVRRLSWRGHASSIGNEMKSNMYRIK